MITEMINYLVCRGVYERVKLLEKNLGYKLDFLSLDPHWIESLVLYDMSRLWQRARLRARGLNYFTFGRVQHGVSTRFEPASPYYQAWLGGYLVQFETTAAPSLSDCWKLGEVDQDGWLALYGDPQPKTKAHPHSFKPLKDSSWGRYPGTLYQWEAESRADVTAAAPNFIAKQMITGLAHFFNFHRPLKMRVAHFLNRPEAAEVVSPHHPLTLKGYAAIVEVNPGRNLKAVLYANGVIFSDRSGVEHNTFEIIKDNLLKGLTGVRIEKI